jgi:hypothetical protein
MEKIKPYLLKAKDFCSKKYVLGVIGAAITIIALFLPFATISVLGLTQSIKFIDGDGVFVLILTIISLVMIFADIIASKLPESTNAKVKAFFKKLANPKFLLIPTIISAIILIVDTSNASDVGTSYYGLASVSYGSGLYFLWIGLILTAVYSVFAKKDEQ